MHLIKLFFLFLIAILSMNGMEELQPSPSLADFIRSPEEIVDFHSTIETKSSEDPLMSWFDNNRIFLEEFSKEYFEAQKERSQANITITAADIQDPKNPIESTFIYNLDLVQKHTIELEALKAAKKNKAIREKTAEKNKAIQEAKRSSEHNKNALDTIIRKYGYKKISKAQKFGETTVKFKNSKKR